MTEDFNDVADAISARIAELARTFKLPAGIPLPEAKDRLHDALRRVVLPATVARVDDDDTCFRVTIPAGACGNGVPAEDTRVAEIVVNDDGIFALRTGPVDTAGEALGDALRAAFQSYAAGHPGVRISIRINPETCLARLRIVDPAFRNVAVEYRPNLVTPYLVGLSADTVDRIEYIAVCTPEEGAELMLLPAFTPNRSLREGPFSAN